MIDEILIRKRYEAMRSCLDEQGRRLFVAAEARAAERPGQLGLHRIELAMLFHPYQRLHVFM
jgi:hypothetical protein